MSNEKKFSYQDGITDVVPFVTKLTKYVASLPSGKQYDIIIKPHRQTRSHNANSYLWVLCDKIARALSKDGAEMYTKEDIYRNAIRQVGVFKDWQLADEQCETFKTAWSMIGLGWLTDDIPGGVRAYYGSSSYNTKRMKRLLDYIVADAKALGIETMTPNELARMESLWQGQ